MSNLNWIEQALQQIISGFPSKRQKEQRAFDGKDCRDLRDLSIRFLLTLLMWKVLRTKNNTSSNNLFAPLESNVSWESLSDLVQLDPIWEKAPGINRQIFSELKEWNASLSSSQLKNLMLILGEIQIDIEGIDEFFNQVYQECCNFELMQVQPEDPFVIRLKTSTRAYISLQCLLTTPDLDTIGNLVIFKSDQPELIKPTTLTHFRELSGDLWGEIEKFNDTLRKSSGNAQIDIFSVIDPADLKRAGQFYLQPMKSLRKGTGTFFTHPDLVKPTVERTISPLLYSFNSGKSQINPPEAFAEIKVLDPAMGVGNFLLIAIEFLSEKFIQSLKHHQRIRGQVSDAIKVIINPESGELWQFRNQQDFESRIGSEIAQFIAYNCIFGVDIDPIAVQIAQFLVYIKIFSAGSVRVTLGSNLVVGNSLIGGWIRDLENYPSDAFARKGSSAGITNIIKIFGQNCKKQASQSIKHEKQEHSRKKWDTGLLKQQLNLWCAIWFWDPGALKQCPFPSSSYLNEQKEISSDIAQNLQFFHWEVEFPAIFQRNNPGFDVVLGNPPWEIIKPNSKEFFGKLDPLYPNMSKQAGLKRQKNLFQARINLKEEWLKYIEYLCAFSNWVKNHASIKVETPESLFYPFQHQGRADLNLFKLFSEISLALLRQKGRLGLILPSGFYSDKGTQELRTFFLEHTQIEWLYSFENLKNIFPIHRNFKFFVFIAEKSGKTEKFHARFMEKDLTDWRSINPHTLELTTEKIHRFSPLHTIIPEILTQQELTILETIYQQSVSLGGHSSNEWEVKYATEFHMTNNSDLFRPASNWNVRYIREFDMTQDSQVFSPRTKTLARGYVKNEFEVWQCPGKPSLLPLYEGKLIDQFDFAQKAYAGGRGLRSKWVPVPYEHKVIETQYLIQKDIYDAWPRAVKSYKIGFQSIARAVDPRTMVAAFLDGLPCLNGVPVLQVAGGDLEQTLVLVSILNSYVYDFALKFKCVGINLNYFLLEETPVLKKENIPPSAWEFLCISVARLNLIHPRFAPAWISLKKKYPALDTREWKRWWVVKTSERITLTCQINAIIALLFGLTLEDYQYILRDDPGNPKGFWRVDKNLPREIRHPNLCIQTFIALQERGLEKFINEGWELPQPAQLYYGKQNVDRNTEVNGTWEYCAQLADKYFLIEPVLSKITR